MSTIPVNTVIQGDCLEVLKTLPDNSVDSIVTDPPAGIAFMSAKWDSPTHLPTHKDDEDEGGEDRATRLKGRQAFISWMTLVMAECLRVLKPGGHMLCWAIPRTSHWTATAIEEAGFEVKDSILHVFGSGFPKSLNVSKAIDKAKGATRKVIKKGKGADKPLPEMTEEQIAERIGPSIMGSTVGINTPAFNARIGEVTEPATPEAKKWDGWGTQLKPAVEVWWLCRKPIAEKNIVSQVLATGTGAINIDGCRVSMTSADASRSARPGHTQKETADGMFGLGGQMHAEQHSGGRWPANLLLSHGPGCRRVGAKKVAAPVINRFTDGAKPFGGGAGHPYESSGGGTEEQAVYECEEGCPVRKLDEQSGVLSSHDGADRGGLRSKASPTATDFKQGVPGSLPPGRGDSGGASRFFQNFEPDYDVPFFYTGKASKADKNADLGPVNPAEEGQTNKHPTVKGQALCRYLVKLVTPPGGIVLDPFAGSGSTLVAATTEGFKFIGIEREAEYFQIAVKRTEKARERAEERFLQQSVFDAMAELEQE